MKIFGLNDFLIERYRTLAESFFAANRKIAMARRLGQRARRHWHLAYYIAYAFIV